MKGLRILTVSGAVLLLVCTAGLSQEPAEASEKDQPGDELKPVESSILNRSGDRAYEVVTPSLGRGYIGYELPAVNSCPCSNDRCFHSCQYYFGGKSYKKSWRRRWLSAHLGHGSMLEAYPCQCLSPGLTRPYWRTVSDQEMTVEPTPAPIEGAPMLPE